jgi:hypothetical protein
VNEMPDEKRTKETASPLTKESGVSDDTQKPRTAVPKPAKDKQDVPVERRPSTKDVARWWPGRDARTSKYKR